MKNLVEEKQESLNMVFVPVPRAIFIVRQINARWILKCSFLYVVRLWIQLPSCFAIEKKIDLHFSFVDFKSAFDSLAKSTLEDAEVGIGIEAKMLT